MHCPICGQQQVSDETRFCSRCGFLLTGIAQVVNNDGIVPGADQTFFAASSPRRKGVLQGVFIIMLALLVVPIITIFTIAIHVGPFAAVISAVMLVMGGLLRAVYALMFEAGVSSVQLSQQQHQQIAADIQNQLPAAQSIPASAYAPPGTGAWRDTNDLAHPGSVTDSTTKLLSKEQKSQ